MISHLYPSKADSTYGSFVHSQVKALLELDCRVTVIAPTAMAPFPLYVLRRKWRRFHLTPKQDSYHGVNVIYPRIIRTPGAALFELAGLNYYHAIKPHVPKDSFDLVHAQIAYPDGWAAARLAKDLNLPLVLTLHGQELQQIVHWSSKLKKMVQYTFQAADKVIAVSPKMAELARQYGAEAAKLKVIYNGVDPLPKSKLPTKIQQLIQGKRVLLSVSRLVESKGIQINLQAMGRLMHQFPDLVYIIVGDGPYRQRLEQLTHSLGLENRVIYAGQQPREQIGAYYASSHLFSLPSRDESFGIVYLEAMAAGLPVIATIGEGIAPLISKQVGRLVSHGDIPALTASISELLEPQLANTLGEEGKRVAAKFSWQENAVAVLELYRNTLSSPVPGLDK